MSNPEARDSNVLPVYLSLYRKHNGKQKTLKQPLDISHDVGHKYC